jgi:hypothetical protein
VDTVAPPESRLDALGPEPFDLRVDECIYWCCCLLRNPDERDFTTHCGEYIVWIAQRKLQVIPEPYPKKALGDWVVADKTAFCWGGYGTVAESVDWVKDIYDRTMKGREQAKKLIK